MKKYIDKSALVAEIERLRDEDYPCDTFEESTGYYNALDEIATFLNTLEVKEVDISSMADDYYDALIKETEMDVDMAGHCRLAYYNGCKDVLNKIQKGE